MWIFGPVIRNPIWDILFSSPDNSAEAARRAAEEATMWRNLFWIAVIVIVVLAFIIWRKHRRDSTKA